jgi:type III restriction enzyme
MSERFFERPILNSPYECPRQHWELDDDGQPTNRIIEMRRRSDLITPVPKPKKRRQARADQSQMLFGDIST